MSDCYPPLPVYPDVSINIPPVDTNPPASNCPTSRYNKPIAYKDNTKPTNKEPTFETTDDDIIRDDQGNIVYTSNSDECNECLHNRYIYPWKDTILIKLAVNKRENGAPAPLVCHYTTNREYTIEPGLFSQFQTFNKNSLSSGKYDYTEKFKLHSNKHLKAAHWIDQEDGDEDY